MKAYQCSACEHLNMADGTCYCEMCINPQPNMRDEESRKKCLEKFKRIENSKIWHEKFSWE